MNSKFIVIGALATFLAGLTAMAAQLSQARVSQVIRDVRLMPSNAAPRPAAVNDNVVEGTAVRTGVESRTELTFGDQTITRLGQNTVFSFRGDSREVRLDSGAVLMQVPQGGAAAQIRTAAVTASITGGTAMMSSNTGYPTKFLILEGSGQFCTNGGGCITLHGGEMAAEMNGHFAGPLKFDVKAVLTSSHLVTDFSPLPNEPLILQVIDEQERQGEAPPPPPGKDELDVTDQRAAASPIPTFTSTPILTPSPTATPSASPSPSPTATITPSPTATPSKFGTPPVIDSPNPYIITSGTTITTDPSITTNGATDYGKIYRSPADDGAFTQWAFGSTSAFDNALNVDGEFFTDPNHLPVAVFKFENLSLNGDPVIDTTNGVTHLALIGVDGITSGSPGGTLTFAGLDGLYLGTVNGSINLTSDVSFANIPLLAMYARGNGSNLTIDSTISNIADLRMAAEGSIQWTNNGDMSVGAVDATAGGNLSFNLGSLTLNGLTKLQTIILPGSTITSGGNVTVNVAGDLINTSSTDLTRLRVNNLGGHVGTGGNVSLTAGNVMTAGDLELDIENISGQIDNGGDLVLDVNRSVQVNSLTSSLENYGGIIGGIASLTLNIGGDLSVAGLTTIDIDQSTSNGPPNLNGGSIDGDAEIGISVGSGKGGSSGNISIGSDFYIYIANNKHSGSSGSPPTIGGEAAVTLSAGTVAVGGFFDSYITNNGGGLIGGDAAINTSVSGQFMAHNGIDFQIDDTIFGGDAGGHISGDALVNISAQDILTPSTNSGIPGSGPMAIEASIYSNAGGFVGGNAIVQVSTTGDISAPGSVLFWVANGNFQNLGGGTIGGNAEVNVTASNLASGDLYTQILNYGGASIGGDAHVSIAVDDLLSSANLYALIDNRAGTIGGDATINFSEGNTTVNSTGSVSFLISNGPYSTEQGVTPVGGVINDGATIEIAAGSLNVDSLLAEIDNSEGQIKGDASISFNVPGATGVAGDATFAIYGSDGAGSASVTFNGGNYQVGGTFLAYIDQSGTISFNTASAHADVLKAGVFGANGVVNIGGGTLSADSQLKLYAPGSNGQINFVSNVTLGGNAAKILAANSVTIFNNVVVTITGPAPADVYTNHANYTGYGGNETTTGTFAGQGAHNPQPLSSAPPFDNSANASSANRSRTATNTRPGGGRGIRIDNSTQLIALLDTSSTGPNGRAIVDPQSARNSNNVDSRSASRRTVAVAERVAMGSGQRSGGVQLR
jgi:hypothetical protein